MTKKLQQTNRYLKELGKLLKRDSKQFDMVKLEEVIKMLREGSPIPPRYFVHPLHGNLKDYMGLHITPDWVLVYRTDKENLYLFRTGTHSDIYG
jgi:mRNA interferase YafQ